MEETKKQNPVVRFVRSFLGRIMEDHVGAYAAQGAFFLILSFIPFVMLILYLIRFTPLSETQVSDAIIAVVPQEFATTVSTLIHQVFQRSGVILPISILLTLWSSGKAVLSLMYGLDTIFRVKRRKNYFVNRAFATLYTVLFVVTLIVALVLMLFGRSLQTMIERYLPPYIAKYTSAILNVRTIIVLSVLALLFLFMYCVLPNRRASVLLQIPGAVIATAGWEILSVSFSMYLRYTPNVAWMYGNLTTVILLMIWIYFCMYVFLGAAEVNKMIEEYIQHKDEPDLPEDLPARRWETGSISSMKERNEREE